MPMNERTNSSEKHSGDKAATSSDGALYPLPVSLELPPPQHTHTHTHTHTLSLSLIHEGILVRDN